MSQRTDRVDELLRQEIGALLAKEVGDPRIGFATITDVETSPDLRHAKVWVSVIGQRADRDETLRALGDAMPFIRHELGRRLRIRRIPDLHVKLDDSAERGTRVLHVLHELEIGTDPDAIEPVVDSLPTPVKRLPHEGDAVDPLAPSADVPADAATPRRRNADRWVTGGPKGSKGAKGRQPGGKGGRPSGANGGAKGGRTANGGGSGPRPRARP
ncbi:MAG TPA: 30S ribosome-binding factor RbfA [Candidatus Limnocylindrales bacterium]